MLNIALHLGQSSDPRVVLVHGFGQAGAVWQNMAEDLAQRGFEVVAPDLPGHGGSDPQYDSADLIDAARLLGEAGDRAFYVGYSLGARVVLNLAQARPDLVDAMVLVGGKPAADSHEAQARVDADDARADYIEGLGDRRLEVFVDEWLAQPFNQRLPEAARFREVRLANRAMGLAESLRHCGSGHQNSIDLRDTISPRALLIRGQYDLPSIVSGSQRLEASIPGSITRVVAGCGHSVPFERPDEFVTVVSEFLTEVARMSAD